MPDFIRSIFTQKSKPSIDYLKVILPFYVLGLFVFVLGMVIATIWR